MSSAGAGTYDETTGTWSLASIASGATATPHDHGDRVACRSRSINTVGLVSLTQTDSDPTNNSASAGVTGVLLADLEIVKTVSQAIARPGDVVRYSVIVTNHGPHDATGIEAFDPFMPNAEIVGVVVPPGTTFDWSNRVWSIPSLPVDESVELLVDVRVQQRRLVPQLRGGARGERARSRPRATTTSYADLFVPAADIDVTKVVDDPAPFVGDQVTFTIGLSNFGPDPSGPVVVDDLLPPGLTLRLGDADDGAPTTRRPARGR